jgi:hypothetical protein
MAATRRDLNPNSPFFHEERHAPLAPFAGRPVTVCGAGALGGNLAETLARMGFARLKVIDRDRVEGRNLSTQPYLRGEVGAPKARALANTLYRAVGAKVEPVVVELTAANAAEQLRGSELVVDAFDNQAARAAVSAAARELGLPCLHVGFGADGLYGSGVWEPGYQVPRDTLDDPCDYPLTRPLALMLAALAARAIREHFAEDRRLDFELTWEDLRITRWER